MIARRKFLQLSAAAATSLVFSSSVASVLKDKSKPLGVQLFTLPQLVSKDFKGALQLLGDIGYQEVEFFGPYAFSAPETIEYWKPIAKQLGIDQNAFYGYSIPDVKKILSDSGLKSHSVHLDLTTLRKNLDPAMKGLSELGVRYAAIPALTNAEERKTLDDFKRLADEFNTLGRMMAKSGIMLVYHNHGYEHWQQEGETPMQILLKNTDPATVTFEMDIFWMKAGGAEPVEFLKNYPGRFKLMHLKDAQEPVRFAGDGGSSDQWMALFPKMADPGTGVFDIKGILQQAIQSGAQHFFLERDLAPDPQTTLKNSYTYLKKIATLEK